MDWSEDLDAQLRELYEESLPVREIAERLALADRLVWTRVQRLRLDGADLPPRRPRWTDTERERLAERRRQGRSLRELEIEFERTRGTITSQLRTLRRLGYDVDSDERN